MITLSTSLVCWEKSPCRAAETVRPCGPSQSCRQGPLSVRALSLASGQLSGIRGVWRKDQTVPERRLGAAVQLLEPTFLLSCKRWAPPLQQTLSRTLAPPSVAEACEWSDMVWPARPNNSHGLQKNRENNLLTVVSFQSWWFTSEWGCKVTTLP